MLFISEDFAGEWATELSFTGLCNIRKDVTTYTTWQLKQSPDAPRANIDTAGN